MLRSQRYLLDRQLGLLVSDGEVETVLKVVSEGRHPTWSSEEARNIGAPPLFVAEVNPTRLKMREDPEGTD